MEKKNIIYIYDNIKFIYDHKNNIVKVCICFSLFLYDVTFFFFFVNLLIVIMNYLTILIIIYTLLFISYEALLTGAIEYSDCTSAEE